MKEAILWQSENEKVRCRVCAHQCLIARGKRGVCGVRENRDGTLYSLVYGKTAALNADPIEKKPLFHFHPGTRALSVSTVGCNFHCNNCQNASISQMEEVDGRVPGREIAPRELVQAARQHRCLSMAYTYTEPAVFLEYALDTAYLAREAGLKNVFVTNGYFTADSLKAVSGVLDAANVDLKAFQNETYRRVCGGELKPVLETLEGMREKDIWLEITTLVIPGLNDSDQELKQIADFIVDLDPGIPWHVSRFHPTYRMTDRAPTPVGTLIRARNIGLERGLRYVYTGNVPGDEGESTFCPGCGARLIHRWGFELASNRLIDSKCPVCQQKIEGRW